MGCKAITPVLVSLAKRHEGRPFHLIASHNQRNDQASVIRYMRGQGLEEGSPNLTLTSFGGHPGVKGNGYVPYYMVFDHTGKLQRQHMAGAYHGGDGNGLVDWVDRLLDETPAIWLGGAEFTHFAKQAKQIESGKGLGKVAAGLEGHVAGENAEQDAEVSALLGALTGWRDRQLASAEALLGVLPKEVLSALGDLEKQLKGSQLAEPVAGRIKESKGGRTLRDAIALAKLLDRTKRKVERLAVPKEAKKRGIKEFDLSDPACRAAHKKALAKAAASLRQAVAEHPESPMVKALESYAASLEGGR